MEHTYSLVVTVGRKKAAYIFALDGTLRGSISVSNPGSVAHKSRSSLFAMTTAEGVYVVDATTCAVIHILNEDYDHYLVGFISDGSRMAANFNDREIKSQRMSIFNSSHADPHH